MSWQFAATRVTGTAEAIELLESLKTAHGPLAFAGTGSSCDGGEVLCLTRAELLPDPDDIRVGELGGAPVYVDGTRYELWGRPEFVIDVAAGPASGIGLEGLEKRHFITRSRSPRASRRLHPSTSAQ
jgi:hypothetical protein